MKFAFLTLLASCWPNPPTTYVRTRYLHDLPLSCAAVVNERIKFPSAVDVGKEKYVHELADWIESAAYCLGLQVYDVSWFVEPVKAQAEVGP